MNETIKNIIIIAVIFILVGGAIIYILRAKKKGAKCIGCPYAKQCSNTNRSATETVEKNEKCCCSVGANDDLDMSELIKINKQ